MFTIATLKKFLIWANLGLYHKSKPLHQLEVQNDAPHYKINNLNDGELNDVIIKFNKILGESNAEQVQRKR